MCQSRLLHAHDLHIILQKSITSRNHPYRHRDNSRAKSVRTHSHSHPADIRKRLAPQLVCVLGRYVLRLLSFEFELRQAKLQSTLTSDADETSTVTPNSIHVKPKTRAVFQELRVRPTHQGLQRYSTDDRPTCWHDWRQPRRAPQMGWSVSPDIN